MWVLPATNILNLQVSHDLSAGLLGLLDEGLFAALSFHWFVLSFVRLGNLVTPLRDSRNMFLQLMLVRQGENGVIRTVLALDGRFVKLWRNMCLIDRVDELAGATGELSEPVDIFLGVI